MSVKLKSTISGLDKKTHEELVRDIKANITSLKSSIDCILHDMDTIRATRIEILERLDNVKNENDVNNIQIQETLRKANNVMRTSEGYRYRLQHVVKRINDIGGLQMVKHSHTAREDVNCNVNTCNNSQIEGGANMKRKTTSIDINTVKRKLYINILENNKYLLKPVDPNDENKDNIQMSKFNWNTNFSFKQLQLIVKMKVYKLRNHYERLPCDQDLYDRLPLIGCHINVYNDNGSSLERNNNEVSG